MTLNRVVNVTENPDSLEIGSPSKGGVKVYGDFNNKQAFSDKLNVAMELLAQAKAKYDELLMPITPKAV